MEKWQRQGFESFRAWRLAEQKRRDDAKKAARAEAARPSPAPLLAVALAMPVAPGTRDACVLDSCPGSTCTGHGTAHAHRKRVRLASVPFASVVGQLPTPIVPLTVTMTDPEARHGDPRRHLEKTGEILESVELTPGGSRVHRLERTTPRGTRRTAEYSSPKGEPEPGDTEECPRDAACRRLRLSSPSRAAQARISHPSSRLRAVASRPPRIPLASLSLPCPFHLPSLSLPPIPSPIPLLRRA